jgi:MFS family permease
MLSPIGIRQVQRRTMTVLLMSQVLGSIGVTLTFAIGGILAVELSGSTSAAGYSQAIFTLGTGAASYALATWMNRQGRRGGLAAGYLVGALGAGACVVAATIDNFPLLVVGIAALGASNASTNSARFVATDLASPAHRATALSMVLWVATAGAVLGPLMIGSAEGVATSLGLPPLTGPFLIDMLCSAIAAAIIFAFLRPDPLIVARTVASADPRPPTPSLIHTANVTAIAPAIAALVLSHAAMLTVMVMTPLEMHHHGATHTAIGAAISVHFIGMYAFAPLSGLLADRAGVRPALVVGSMILVSALFVFGGAVGESSLIHGMGLFLLGLGWSVCTVAASSHIATRTLEDTRIQGLADTAMTIVSAATAAAAGPLMALWGFNALIGLGGALTLGVLLATLRIRDRDPVRVPTMRRTSARQP